MHFRDAFARSVRVHGERAAVVTPGGDAITYRELDERATRLSDALDRRIGQRRVAVLARNGAPAVESMIAGQRRGVATVQLPFRGGAGELVEMAETAAVDGLVFDDETADVASEVVERIDPGAVLHAGDRDVPGVESYETALAEASPALPAGLPAGDECAVFYTSGTTSRPKAVVFDGEDMWLGAIQGVMEHGIDYTDTAVVTTPWYHMVTADAWLYPHFLAGATCLLEPSFEPRAVLDRIESERATGLLAVPTQLDALAEAQAEAGFDLDSLSYIRTAGAILDEDLVERVRRLLDEELVNSYGMTEAGPDMTFAHPAAQDDRPGTVGREAFAWELRVVETAPLSEQPDPAATVDAGEQGEVIARGPGMADGYLDNDAAERRTFFDGWLRTRDVARIDDEGYLYIVDRVDNMFTSGGENIYPAEVQRVLERHDAVTEALVVGLDDDHWGQRVTAVVVTDGAVDEAALDAHCRRSDRLADYKRPREYAFRSEPLPRTDTGTVERERVVREHFG